MIAIRALPALLAASTLLQTPPVGGPDSEPRSRTLARELSASTRLAGTCGTLWGAELTAREFERAGFSVELESHEVELSYPRRISLEIFADHAADHEHGAPISARLERFDPDALPPGDVPLYNAWAKSGDVRGAVVDAGFALRADFERLKSLGVDVHGKVVIARYGKAYRGCKVELAAEFGAAAVLLFTDPSEDGAAKGDVWPKGPWKPDTDAQRGSILSIAHDPGDPSTPGTPSPKPGERGERLTGAALESVLPTIPCIPIGAREAKSILERLAKVGEKDESIGPGPAEVRLVLDEPRELRTIVDVIATLRGASEDCVIAGAHRDAWVRGMDDDGAGVVTLIRAAEHLGQRAKSGWKPKNTIRIALWDAEEFGLIGSTEYGEAHADELKRHALLYINSDSGCGGFEVHAGGTPGLLGLVQRTLEDIDDPSSEEPRNLWQQLSLKAPNGRPALGFPGSGSDFAVFLHHLSIPVLDVGFGGTSGGQYHTRFDDFEIVDRFLDPGWAAHELAGSTLAELLGRAADEGASLFDEAEAANTMAAMVRAAATEGGEHPWLGHDRGERLARAFDDFAQKITIQPKPSTHFYADLAAQKGLPNRAWFVNRLWAPGVETGYSSETLPELRLASARGDNELDRALSSLIAAVEALAARRSRP